MDLTKIWNLEFWLQMIFIITQIFYPFHFYLKYPFTPLSSGSRQCQRFPVVLSQPSFLLLLLRGISILLFLSSGFSQRQGFLLSFQLLKSSANAF